MGIRISYGDKKLCETCAETVLDNSGSYCMLYKQHYLNRRECSGYYKKGRFCLTSKFFRIPHVVYGCLKALKAKL